MLYIHLVRTVSLHLSENTLTCLGKPFIIIISIDHNNDGKHVYNAETRLRGGT